MTKNEKISASARATREKRKSQECKVFELKVDKSHLSKQTAEKLKLLFLEAKWLYNYTLSKEDPFSVSYKLKEVEIKVKDEYQSRKLTTLSCQIKQGVLQGLRQNIFILSIAKKKGLKVGRLNYISHYDSINLVKYGETLLTGVYRFKGNRVRIHKISQWLTVNGLSQLRGYEIANAKFIQRAGDYYFKVTCFKDKIPESVNEKPLIGIDFGISHQLTLGDGSDSGLSLNYACEFPKRIKRLQRKLKNKKVKHTSNRNKLFTQIRKEYLHWNNKKADTKNKICNILKDFRVCFQDDNLRGWQRIWGRKMLSTAIGGITAKLKKSATTIVIDRFIATTKTCSKCHHKQDMKLSDREFICESCGYTAPRDLNSANNMIWESNNKIGVEYAELKPVETRPLLAAYLERFNAIPRLQASLICEAGSTVAKAEGNSLDAVVRQTDRQNIIKSSSATAIDRKTKAAHKSGLWLDEKS